MRRTEPAAADLIGAELRLIREKVVGVRGSVTATSDGLLVAHDVIDLEPTQVAALVAALHAVAVRTAATTDCGQFREAITRGSDGYLAVYAAGPAIVAILGTSDLNVGMLNYQARRMIERIKEHAAVLGRPAAGARPRPARDGAPLPVRRPRRS